jgi:hypothetical protein
MEKPKPVPAAIASWTAAWSAKPAALWAHGIYKKHRLATKDFDGVAPQQPKRPSA